MYKLVCVNVTIIYCTLSCVCVCVCVCVCLALILCLVQALECKVNSLLRADEEGRLYKAAHSHVNDQS